MDDLFGLNEIDKIQEEIERDLTDWPRTEAKSASEPIHHAQELPELTTETFASLFLVPTEPVEPPQPRLYTVPHPTPQKSWLKAAVILFFVCTVGMGTLGFGIGAGWAIFRGQATPEAATAPDRANQPENAALTGTTYVFEPIPVAHEITSISGMVELIAPSVVGITSYADEIRFPFAPPTSYGSGIIFAYTEDRIFIATNHYIVRFGYRWDVSIEGSPPIPALPAGHRSEQDLAVAYIYKSQLAEAGIDTVTFATFGNSDEMRIGDVVLAIGNAMGEGTSVTRGIISAAERPIFLPGREYPLTLLQTDAAINYGNSGGPLINTRGEVIGINNNQATAQIIGSTQVEGMGYSISSNIAAPVLTEIVTAYRTPAIGIMGDCLANDAYNRAGYWGIPEFGVLVHAVQEGRPAYEAGIRRHDVITAFNGQPIFTMPQLQTAIRERQIGETVEIRILRDGTQVITLQMELAIMQRDNFFPYQ